MDATAQNSRRKVARSVRLSQIVLNLAGARYIPPMLVSRPLKWVTEDTNTHPILASIEELLTLTIQVFTVRYFINPEKLSNVTHLGDDSCALRLQYRPARRESCRYENASRGS